MEQKDIDRLLACRKAIDDHRARKADARISTQTVVPKQNVFEASRDMYLKVLADNGFENYDAFVKFNLDMCVELLAEYRTMYGECDKCEGYKADPPCWDLYGKENCVLLSGEINKEFFYQLMLASAKLGVSITPENIKTGVYTSISAIGKEITHNIHDGIVRFICPDGHGYWHKCEVPDLDFPFSVSWK